MAKTSLEQLEELRKAVDAEFRRLTHERIVAEAAAHDLRAERDAAVRALAVANALLREYQQDLADESINYSKLNDYLAQQETE